MSLELNWFFFFTFSRNDDNDGNDNDDHELNFTWICRCRYVILSKKDYLYRIQFGYDVFSSRIRLCVH